MLSFFLRVHEEVVRERILHAVSGSSKRGMRSRQTLNSSPASADLSQRAPEKEAYQYPGFVFQCSHLIYYGNDNLPHMMLKCF